MIRSWILAVALSTAAVPALAVGAAPDPASLFSSERAAAGAGWSSAGEIVERGTYTGSGSSGPYVTYVDPRTGFSTMELTIAGVTQTQGYDAKGVWSAQSGLVEPLEDAASVASGRTAAYIARNGWWTPATDPATFAYLGQKAAGNETYDVVRVTPQGGDAVDVWLDSGTHLIGRLVETNLSNVTSTTTLSDYRLVEGMQYPYATTVSTGDPKNDQQTRVASVAVAATATVADFVRPQNKRTGTIAGGSSTTVPFHIDDPSKGHIVVAVRVNGSRPLQMIFDTGGSNVVSPAVAREIGLHGGGSTAVGGAGEQQSSAQIASGATLLIGGATLTDQPFGILPLPPSLKSPSGAPIDGIVGYEILKNFVVRIDYVRQTLTLTDPAAFDPANAGAAVKFASATIPVIPVRFDGVPGAFMFDTGNAFYNTVSQPFLDTHGLASSVRGNVLVQSSGNLGGALRPRIGRVERIAIGPYTIVGPVFAVTNTAAGSLAGTDFAGNIGEPIISRFDVTLDYGSSTIYFKPNVRFNTPFPGSLDGMSLAVTDAGLLVVTYVNPGSPAAKAGLQAGDRIVAVDGVDAAQLGTSAVAVRAVKKRPVAIEFARGNARRTVTLMPAEMVP